MQRVIESDVKVAKLLALASGILIIAGAFTPWIWHQYSVPTMGGMWRVQGITPGISWIGIVSGALILLGALMMHYNPMEVRRWGILVLVFAVISFLGIQGSFIGPVLGIGAVLGIIAGVLAFSTNNVIEAEKKYSVG